MNKRLAKLIALSSALVAVVALVSVTAGSASVQRSSSTQYAILTAPDTAAAASGSFSQSIVVRTSGVGFVEYGFTDGVNVWPFGCSASSCTKDYNASGGPGFRTGVFCEDKTGTSVWSCQYN